MKNRRQLATWLGVILGTVCALLLAAAEGRALQAHGKLTEEFHQTYPLSEGGRIELQNINGAVHIAAWDSNQVKVGAVMYANSQERLDEAKIRIDADKDRVSIRTEYGQHDPSFDSSGENNPASVEYTLTVPRGARLDEISLTSTAQLDPRGVQRRSPGLLLYQRTARGQRPFGRPGPIVYHQRPSGGCDCGTTARRALRRTIINQWPCEFDRAIRRQGGTRSLYRAWPD